MIMTRRLVKQEVARPKAIRLTGKERGFPGERDEPIMGYPNPYDAYLHTLAFSIGILSFVTALFIMIMPTEPMPGAPLTEPEYLPAVIRFPVGGGLLLVAAICGYIADHLIRIEVNFCWCLAFWLSNPTHLVDIDRFNYAFRKLRAGGTSRHLLRYQVTCATGDDEINSFIATATLKPAPATPAPATPGAPTTPAADTKAKVDKLEATLRQALKELEELKAAQP
jgi:hypothetical protein